MKVLIAGSFKYETREDACTKGFERLGCVCKGFAWEELYGIGLSGRVQKRFQTGPGINRINRALIQQVKEFKPDLLYIYRGVPIRPVTLEKIKKYSSTIIASFNNDDPFGTTAGWSLWRNFKKSIPLYDVHFVFRKTNVDEYASMGAKNVKVLMPYYVPWLHYPMNLTDEDKRKYACDVVFVGYAHTLDPRIKFNKKLIDNGVALKNYGPGWELVSKKYNWLKDKWNPAIWGIEYTKAIKASKTALILLSRMNRDTYTSRCFEIPAIGTPMLSERTDDMLRLFGENRHAMYFSSEDELFDKVKFLISHEAERLKMAKNAIERVVELKASVFDRMREVYEYINN